MRQLKLLGGMEIDLTHHHARTPGEFLAADEIGLEDILVAQLLRCRTTDGAEAVQNALLEIDARSHDIERQDLERFERHSPTPLSQLIRLSSRQSLQSVKPAATLSANCKIVIGKTTLCNVSTQAIPCLRGGGGLRHVARAAKQLGVTVWAVSGAGRRNSNRGRTT